MQRFTRNAIIIAFGATAVSAHALINQNQGRDTAVLQKKAARFGARDDYLVQRALCLNDTQGSQHDCAVAAESDLQDAFELINEQFAARLDILNFIGPGPYDPQLAPNEFSSDITNTLFPLVPGRTLVYEVVTPEGVEHIEYQETNVVRTLNGINCREVHDVSSVNGELKEDTYDWFAQRANGDVWYMGEFAQQLAGGFVEGIEGSWRFGKNGAKPGIQMRASPSVGEVYRQEYALGDAEDMARIISIDQSVTVPAGVFPHCLVTDEFSPLDPSASHVELKYFAPGVGLVLTVNLGSGEREELIAVH